jgi:hypothetical protein
MGLQSSADDELEAMVLDAEAGVPRQGAFTVPLPFYRACLHAQRCGVGRARSHRLCSRSAVALRIMRPILYTDYLTPIAILILLFITARSKPTAELSAEVSLVDHLEKAVEPSPTPRIEDELEKARRQCETRSRPARHRSCCHHSIACLRCDQESRLAAKTLPIFPTFRAAQCFANTSVVPSFLISRTS